MNANISVKNFKIDVLKDKVNELELSNGQKFVDEWVPDYNIEYDTEALTVTVSTIWEKFMVFAVHNDGLIELNEVAKKHPTTFTANELYDIHFIFISEDMKKAYMVKDAYPKE